MISEAHSARKTNKFTESAEQLFKPITKTTEGILPVLKETAKQTNTLLNVDQPPSGWQIQGYLYTRNSTEVDS